MDASQLEYYDSRMEQRRLRSFQREMENAERRYIAIQSALNEHPVTSLVKNLPIQDPSYPAIEYLRLAQQSGCSVWDAREVVRKLLMKQSSDDRIRKQTSYPPSDDSLPLYHHIADGSHISDHHPFIECSDFDLENLSTITHEYIHWSMPAHDRSRPKERGCGFINSKSGGMVYSACPGDFHHHCKGKRMHCWSLHCPDCMNDTALRNAIKVERQLLVYHTLMLKQGNDVGNLGHWVVSPPQELGRCLMQTIDEYDDLCRYVDCMMQTCGALAGVTVFHPWRQQSDDWKLSPHFHILCYGHIDTKHFLSLNPGWIVKKVHPRERIRSIRHTVAYLMTHMGLATVEHDPDDVDWDLDILDHLIPGIKSPGAHFNDRDIDLQLQGKGRMAGDLSHIDWVQWTMDRLSRETRIRYWGGVARNRIRTIGIHRQYRIRVCKECGEMLRVYDGDHDSHGNYVRYIQDNPVLTFAHHFDEVRTAFLRYKADLRMEGIDIAGFAAMIPQAVSTLEIGLPTNNDILLDGPFDEPDERFLSRQRNAIGHDMR